jgi:hypothetical protein
VAAKTPDGTLQYSFYTMNCANKDCKEVLVQVEEQRLRGPNNASRKSWLFLPRDAHGRVVNPIVRDEAPTLAEDYQEASLILTASPRMSAVLSRSILADLLEKYAGRHEFNLGDRLRAFAADLTYPSSIRDNVRYLKEIGDFGAHTQKDKSDQRAIINVTPEEAEWTIDLVERLFEYFIVSPKKDAEMQAAFREKMEAAGRKAIPPLPTE